MKIIRFVYHTLLMVRDFFICKVSIGVYDKSWRFWGVPELSFHKFSTVKIGTNFVACSVSRRNSIGITQRVILKTTHNNAQLVIGDNVGISGCTISCSKYISIGSNTMIGSGVLIVDNDAHAIHPSMRKFADAVLSDNIIICEDVFIGARSIVLKGVTIGRGSVIGAGSVVVRDIPEMCIAAGNPAKVVRKIEDL